MLEPFDPARSLRVARNDSAEVITFSAIERQERYDRELAAFVAVLGGEQPPDRSAEHELLVQETLLRCTGRLA